MLEKPMATDADECIIMGRQGSLMAFAAEESRLTDSVIRLKERYL